MVRKQPVSTDRDRPIAALRKGEQFSDSVPSQAVVNEPN